MTAVFLAGLLVMAAPALKAQNYYAANSSISYQQFYDDLSPYGNWINYPGQGYVWAPYETNFTPYHTNGNWAYTRYGWTWVSNYKWGWAPFHYGRWINDPYYGWLWIPGYEWGPAWVEWRSGGDYYGWAPMGPRGINIHINFWNFIPRRYITYRDLGRYYVNNSRNVTIIKNTTIINNYYNNGARKTYNAGPSVADVQKSTRTKVREFNIAETNNPGNAVLAKNEIRIYKPVIKENQDRNIEAKPQRVISMDQFKNSKPQVKEFAAQSESSRPQVNDGKTSLPQRTFGNRKDDTSPFQENGITNANSREVKRSTNNLPVQSEINRPTDREVRVAPERELNHNLPSRQATTREMPSRTFENRNTAPRVQPSTNQVQERQVRQERSSIVPNQRVNTPVREVTPQRPTIERTQARPVPSVRETAPRAAVKESSQSSLPVRTFKDRKKD